MEISMENQAEQIEDNHGIEKSKHEAQAYDRPLPEIVVATSGDAEMNENKQSLINNDKTATNGVNPSLLEDEGFEGDPNLFVPQYEYPDGEDEAKDIDNVDGKGQPNLVVPQSNNLGGEGEAKAHNEGNDGIPKGKKQHQEQKTIGLGEAQKPKKKKKKSKSKRGLVSSPTRYPLSRIWLDECKRQRQMDLKSTTLMCQYCQPSMKKREAFIMSKFWN